jgi:UDP-glucose 4-epimerase
MTTARPRLVIGHGLLGSAVAVDGVEARRAVVPWSDDDAAVAALSRQIEEFLRGSDGPAEICWCAGRGVTTSAAAVLDAEVTTFTRTLAALRALDIDHSRVRFFLASSVGAAYGGAQRPPFTEATEPQPASEYGAAKLRMEDALAHATELAGWRSFTARITNLYGRAQDPSKGQGLISTIARTYVTGAPASVYVSLDTLRDYIYVGDCARIISAGLRRLDTVQPGQTVLKIVGAMTAISIAAIIGEYSRLRRKRPLVVIRAGSAVGQAPDLRVRSTVWTDLDGLVRTTLPEGLGLIHAGQVEAVLYPGPNRAVAPGVGG